jgi:hypothetical protein
MRLPLLVLLVAPLAVIACGGEDDDGAGATGCTIRVGSETLLCAVSAFDYATLEPEITEWGVQLVGTRSDGRVMATVQLILPSRPIPGQAYGWNGTTTSVAGGWATFSTIASAGALPYVTHEAEAPFADGEPGTGALTARFTAIPPPGSAPESQLAGLAGTIDATLAATDAGGTVAVHAVF